MVIRLGRRSPTCQWRQILIDADWWLICLLKLKQTPVVSLNARQAKPKVHLADTTRVCFHVNKHIFFCLYDTYWVKMYTIYWFMWRNADFILISKLGTHSSLYNVDSYICHCYAIYWDKQSYVTMAWRLTRVFLSLDFNLCISQVL